MSGKIKCESAMTWCSTLSEDPRIMIWKFRSTSHDSLQSRKTLCCHQAVGTCSTSRFRRGTTIIHKASYHRDQKRVTQLSRLCVSHNRHVIKSTHRLCKISLHHSETWSWKLRKNVSFHRRRFSVHSKLSIVWKSSISWIKDSNLREYLIRCDIKLP